MKSKSVNLLIGMTIAVLIPVGFWYYYFIYKGLPQSLPKYFPTGEVVKWKFHGQDRVDSVYHTIAPFALYDQDSNLISNDTLINNSLKDKIYIAEFFFCSCNTICPKMTKELLKVQETFKDVKWINILSFTVDPERDSVKALKRYADKFKIKSDQWHLLTGSREVLYNLSLKSFFLAAQEDGPESFDHSNKVVLIDNRGVIRGYYDGTNPVEIQKLIKDCTNQLKDLSYDVLELRPPRK